MRSRRQPTSRWPVDLRRREPLAMARRFQVDAAMVPAASRGAASPRLVGWLKPAEVPPGAVSRLLVEAASERSPERAQSTAPRCSFRRWEFPAEQILEATLRRAR